MILTKTPYRMSFFGGGTDYPDYYMKHGGQTLSVTFNKFCYISCRRLPPFFEHKHRIVYSAVENVATAAEIKHPAVRAILKEFPEEYGLEIHHDGDLPARSGLGSSSSFAVGLVNALRALQGKLSTKKLLADEAIRIEQCVLQETVGSQDQIAAAYGGFNNIIYNIDGTYLVKPLVASRSRINYLNDHLLLFFSGTTRLASTIAEDQVANTNKNLSALQEINDQVNEAMNILENKYTSLDSFGLLLNEAWKIKRGLSRKISSPYLDNIYETAISNGAIGGELMGAGGGGFMMFFAQPENHSKIIKSLRKLIHIPFKFEYSGSVISIYEPE